MYPALTNLYRIVSINVSIKKKTKVSENVNKDKIRNNTLHLI